LEKSEKINNRKILPIEGAHENDDVNKFKADLLTNKNSKEVTIKTEMLHVLESCWETKDFE